MPSRAPHGTVDNKRRHTSVAKSLTILLVACCSWPPRMLTPRRMRLDTYCLGWVLRVMYVMLPVVTRTVRLLVAPEVTCVQNRAPWLLLFLLRDCVPLLALTTGG